MAKTVWASASNADIAAPSVEKIALGWKDKEYPPNEWFNWMQNRTDTRLNELEDSRIRYTYKIDKHSDSRATYANNSQYTVPTYTVGSGDLEVYIDGVLCTKDESYSEVGAAGNQSTKIKWLQAINNTYDIVSRAPVVQ